MKKKLIIIASLCAFLFCGYFVYNRMNTHYVQLDGDRDYCDTFNKLEEVSELIVEVKATDKIETHYDIMDENFPAYGWTTKEVIVNKAYKAPEGFSENTLIIREPYWEYTSPTGQRFVMYLDDYRPMKLNKTYILFLHKNADGTYWPTFTDQGKYLKSDKLDKADLLDSYRPDDFEIGGEVPNYRDFYKEIIKKYK